MTETHSTTGPDFRLITEKCVYVPISVLKLVIHKMEQTSKGQYSEGQALDAALQVLRPFVGDES